MKTIAILNVLLLVASASADDWTQWAGNDRQCTWNETGILKKFPADGLKPTWSIPIGSGYSGPVVWQGRVFVTDYRPKPGTEILEAVERVLCLDEQSGLRLRTTPFRGRTGELGTAGLCQPARDHPQRFGDQAGIAGGELVGSYRTEILEHPV